MAPAVPHPLEFSGKASENKRRELARLLVADKADAAVLDIARIRSAGF